MAKPDIEREVSMVVGLRAYLVERAAEVRKRHMDSLADEAVVRSVRFGGVAGLALTLVSDLLGWANNPMRSPRPGADQLHLAAQLDGAGTAVRHRISRVAILGGSWPVITKGPRRGVQPNLPPIEAVQYPEAKACEQGYGIADKPPFLRVEVGGMGRAALVVSLWTPPIPGPTLPLGVQPEAGEPTQVQERQL